MALRRLLALAAAATVAADVVQVAILCDYLEARTAGRQDCDTAIAAVDAINNKRMRRVTRVIMESSLNAWHAR